MEAMSDATNPRPAVKLKHLYAALAAFAAYFVTAVVGMWVGMTGGLVLQELGLFRKWAAHIPLWKVSLLFASGLALAAGGLLLLWKMRRPLILAAKMCWYVPKAVLVYLAGETPIFRGLLAMITFFALWVGLIWGFQDYIWSQPWWLQAIELVAVGAFGVGATVAVGLATKVALRVAKVDDWRASVARSLGKIDMLAPPAASPLPDNDA